MKTIAPKVQKDLSQKFDVTGKTAIVTGGGGFLASFFADALATFGANVILADIDTPNLQKNTEQLKSVHGQKVTSKKCDVTLQSSVKQLVEETVNQFGSVEILINNAATKSNSNDSFFAPFEEYSLETWREVMSVNIDGMFLAAQAVGKQMVEQGQGGSIIQVSSIYGLLGPDHSIYKGDQKRAINAPAVYSASKAAVIGLTKYLATYWGANNIRVNTLIPGGVENNPDPEFRKRYSEKVPLKRMAQAEDLVGAILYLASDASSYVTGQEIIVDGGFTAW